jgi:hypothetical protein
MPQCSSFSRKKQKALVFKRVDGLSEIREADPGVWGLPPKKKEYYINATMFFFFQKKKQKALVFKRVDGLSEIREADPGVWGLPQKKRVLY